MTEPLQNITIGNYFDTIVHRYPHNPALVVKYQLIKWTYRNFQQQVERLAAGLLAVGIEPGDRVGIWAPNCAEWCCTQLATAKFT